MQRVAEHVCDITSPLGCRENETEFATGPTLEWVIHRVRLAVS